MFVDEEMNTGGQVESTRVSRTVNQATRCHWGQACVLILLKKSFRKMTKELFAHKCPTIDFLGWVNDF